MHSRGPVICSGCLSFDYASFTFMNTACGCHLNHVHRISTQPVISLKHHCPAEGPCPPAGRNCVGNYGMLQILNCRKYPVPFVARREGRIGI